MEDLDTLGARHRQLLEDLDKLKPLLADAIRAERAKGATYVALLARSGYRSIEGIKQVIDPDRRSKMNQDRRGEGRTA